MRPGAYVVLRAAQVVALVVAPERNTRFVRVVENIASGKRVPGREQMVDTTGVIVLRRKGAAGRGGEVLRSHLRVGLRHELQKHQRLLAQARGRDHVVGDTNIQRVAQSDWSALAGRETTEITRSRRCRGD